MHDLSPQSDGFDDHRPPGALRRKIRTLEQTYRRGGIGGVLRHSASRVASPARKILESATRHFDRWYHGDNWWLGKIVELRGNLYSYNGITISLDNPRILTRLKSRFFRGDYERDERRMLPLYLRRELPTVEVGACIGVVSCIANRLLERPERHVVVEANPYLIPTLEANRDRNGCRFTVLNRALAYGSPSLAFAIHELFVGGSVQRNTSECVDVATTSLREILDTHGFDVVNLVFDAEGAEVDLLEHEAELLGKRVATLIIELHGRIVGESAIGRVVERLERMGFTLEERSEGSLYDSTCVYVNRSIEGCGVTGH